MLAGGLAKQRFVTSRSHGSLQSPHSLVRASEHSTGHNPPHPLPYAYVLAYVQGGGMTMTSLSATNARANLYRLIDQVNEESEEVTITGQRGNAVLVGEEDWRAIQETLHLMSIPGMTDSIRHAQEEGIEAGSTELDW